MKLVYSYEINTFEIIIFVNILQINSMKFSAVACSVQYVDFECFFS